MPANIRTLIFENARDVIEYLLGITSNNSIYRGQADARWDLTPSAWRQNRIGTTLKIIKEYMKDDWKKQLTHRNTFNLDTQIGSIIPTNDPKELENLEELVKSLTAERFIVSNFLSECDSAGLPLPGITNFGMPNIDYHTLLDTSTKNKIISYDVPIYEISTSYALAQHHGIPTRLLDFSDNPFKAAYFAASEAKRMTENPDTFAIWVATPPQKTDALISAFLADDTVTFRVPRSYIPYLHAQDGLFLSCNASSNLFFIKNGRWPSYGEIMHGWSLDKLIVPTKSSDDVIRFAYKIGITESRIKPSYEAIARSAKEMYSA